VTPRHGPGRVRRQPVQVRQYWYVSGQM
jgi:hypothetical protein